MRIAITTFHGRISTLFDSANVVIIVDVADGKELKRLRLDISGPSPYGRVLRLVEHRVDVLICGAIERSSQQLLEEAEIKVSSWVAGKTRDVLSWAIRMGSRPEATTADSRSVGMITVSADSPLMDATVTQRFGRSPFLIHIVEDLVRGVDENPNLSFGGGAGVRMAHLVAHRGSSLLLTGSCGPNALGTLRAAGVVVVTRVSGNVRRAVEQFRNRA